MIRGTKHFNYSIKYNWGAFRYTYIEIFTFRKRTLLKGSQDINIKTFLNILTSQGFIRLYVGINDSILKRFVFLINLKISNYD